MSDNDDITSPWSSPQPFLSGPGLSHPHPSRFSSDSHFLVTVAPLSSSLCFSHSFFDDSRRAVLRLIRDRRLSLLLECLCGGGDFRLTRCRKQLKRLSPSDGRTDNTSARKSF